MFRLDISVMESAAVAISHCRRQGVRIIATTPHCHEDLRTSNFSVPCAVALGNEADGLSGEMLAGADLRLRVKMLRTLDSLNVAVATGIVLHFMMTRSGSDRMARERLSYEH